MSLSRPKIECKSLQRSLFDHARQYADRGLSVFPVIGKHPAVDRWIPFRKHPPDADTLRELFADSRITGIAAIGGSASNGLAVRDFDRVDTYQAWADANPADAGRLPTVKTMKGFHVYGRLGEEAYVDFGNGELRADSKHYTLLPPSRHPDGPIYTWINPLPQSGPLSLLPPSLTKPPNLRTQPARRRAGCPQPTQASARPLTLLHLPLTRHTEQRRKTKPHHQTKQTIACLTSTVIDAIEATLPTGPGQRNRRVFDLARYLRSITDLDTSPPILKAILIEWHRRALPVIGTKEFAVTWVDFQTAWLNVKVPYGASVSAAYAAAVAAPYPAIDDIPELGVLAALCKNLSDSSTGLRFYLASTTVERLFGVSRMTGWRWLVSLEFQGIIKLITNGTQRDRQASEWRFIGQGIRS
jgi:hypothetical protein